MTEKVESPTVKYGKGSYFVPSNRSPWPHEILTAKALSKAGFDVVFLPEKGSKPKCDAEFDEVLWEFKSPKTNKLSQIENNLKKASLKTPYIVIDSCRIVSLPDKKIEMFLIEHTKKQKTIKTLLYINRRREVIDITKLI